VSAESDTMQVDERGEIDRSSPIPLYHQLEYLLRRDIEGGRYHIGDPLPSEGEICSRYGVSRSVVRQTLTNLAHAGLIRTERGRGSFVAEQKLQERFVQRATGLYDDLRRMGYHIRTEVVRQLETQLPLQVQAFLEAKKGVQIDRVRSIDGRVLAFIRTYLSPTSCPGLHAVDLEDRSLYEVLAEEYGLRIGSGRRTVEAVAAEGEIARHLGVDDGEPVLLLRSASRDEQDRPLEWFEAWHRGDRTMFEIEIVPGEADRPFSSIVRPPTGTEPLATRTDVATWSAPPARDPQGDTRLVDTLRTARVVAVLRATRYADPGAITELLAAHGFPVVEFTLTGENALEAIAVAREVDDVLVGAGTVLTAADARDAIAAGADFLVSPVGSQGVLAAAGPVPVILAGFTPSEVWAAWAATAAPVKVYPASVGGPDYVQSLHAPMRDVPLLPSGGIDATNAAAYLRAGATAVCIGGALCPAAALEQGDLDVIAERARAIRDALAGLDERD
jgi:GntR family transcriptional regulator